jgi:ketosteroid isomerase-like protein
MTGEEEQAMFAARALLLGGLCLVAACTRSAPQVGPASAADVAAVARTVATFDSCARTGALDVFMGYVADDAEALFPDMPAIVGKQALRAFYGSYYGGFRIDGHHAPIETETIGDLVINRGEVHGTVTPKAGGQPMPVGNKYLMIFRRQPDGSLKVWRAAANSNAPATPPAQTR